jgi:hypothetical protein
MENIERYRALEAFCRQRAQMDGEGSAFWLEEAEILAQLVMTESRLKKLAASNDDEKWAPDLGA